MHYPHRDPGSVPYIYDVDEHGFEEKVLEASRRQPVMVDFWADWCPPCVALGPTLDTVARERAGAVVLAKVEVDDNMRLAGRFKLRGFPTVILFRDGEPVAHFAGNRPMHWVREWLDEHAGAH